MQTIHPMLWFNGQAEEAAKYYVSVFPNSEIRDVVPYGGGENEGKVMTVEFILDGQKFVALNGGPEFKFNESVSFVIPCESQAEVDDFWNTLVDGGTPSYCGWLKDRFGLSWQVVPTALTRMLEDDDPEKVRRVTEAMLAVVGKFDIAELEAAFDGTREPAAVR
jgi:predicted 3-demethylubiquinone-9 3-methyltransferase (glyoxalase superfamily)